VIPFLGLDEELGTLKALIDAVTGGFQMCGIPITEIVTRQFAIAEHIAHTFSRR